MRLIKTTTLFIVAGLAACSGSEPATETVPVATDAPKVTFTPEGRPSHNSKPMSPVKIAYRIVGKPVVGQPVVVDLSVESNYGPTPIQLDYRLPDSTALEMPQTQAASFALAVTEEEPRSQHQVTVIPQREGRLYLNVSAEIQTPDGSMSTVTAIPIQVGTAPRELVENGTVIETEDGQLIRSMPAQ